MSVPLTIIYAGPTIDAKTIHHHLPDASIHPPIQCGDALKAIRINAKRLIIIDGFFEHKASVWHKEILLAMNHGIEVIGASSLGVLRAVELEPFGMIGIGEIYDWYRQGHIDSDDEVAVVHYPEAANFEAGSDALVNIRKTLQLALSQKVLSQKEHDTLLLKAQSTFYRQRHWPKLLSESHLSKSQVSWLIENYCDLKRQDAVEALTYAANHPPKPPKRIELCHNQLLNVQIHTINLRPFDSLFDWLPDREKQTIHWLSQPHEATELVKELSKLCNLTLRLFEPFKSLQSVEITHFDHLYQASQDEDFLQILAFINQLIQSNQLDLKKVQKIYPYLRLMFFSPRKKTSTSTQSALVFFAVLWVILNDTADKAKLLCESSKVREYYRDLTHKIGHPSVISLQNFLADHNLSEGEFIALCYQGARFRYTYRHFLGSGLVERTEAESKNWLWPVISVFFPTE